jgi:hypothetical protein
MINKIKQFFRSDSGRYDARKFAIAFGIVATIVLIITGMTGCTKDIDRPSSNTLVALIEQRKPADLYIQERGGLLPLDTNIVDNYDGFATYFPYIEYSVPQDLLPLENMVHGVKSNGDLRGARDTVNNVDYFAYWFDASYSGVERNWIIYTLRTDQNQNWVYSRIAEPSAPGIFVNGETFEQVPDGENPFGYGTIKVYNSSIAINGVGPYDINPLIDSEGRFYVDAYWDLEVQLIEETTGDTLKGRSYSFIRTEGIPPSTITGVGRLKAADPELAGGISPTFELVPYTIDYEGTDVEVIVYPGSLHSFALGAGNTSESTIAVQGFSNGQLINIPIERFSKIIYKSNRGEGASYEQY